MSAAATALVLPEHLIEFLGESYLALPQATRVRISFERYLIYRVRNGALFEKFTCPRVHRRSSSRHFKPSEEAR